MRVHFSILMLMLSLAAKAQNHPPNTMGKHLGLSAQLYPAGIIATGMAMFELKKSTAVIARLGVNLADRQDFSPYNDNEKGWGFGGTIGYRKSIAIKYGTLFAGANLDVWNMWIDWRNDIGMLNETSGQTYTLVLQPWAELGYQYTFKNTPLLVSASLGFGREINTITNGKEVGQGWMRSATICLMYRVK